MYIEKLKAVAVLAVAVAAIVTLSIVVTILVELADSGWNSSRIELASFIMTIWLSLSADSLNGTDIIEPIAIQQVNITGLFQSKLCLNVSQSDLPRYKIYSNISSFIMELYYGVLTMTNQTNNFD